MANNEIMVKDLSTTSSLSTDNKLMLLTDEANNTVQNITVENALANIISSNANNSLSIGTDKKLYSADISGEVGDLTNLITSNKNDIVSAINEVKGDTNAITDEVVSASKGWLEEGEIYQKANWYGEKLYNDVYYYNHSTFDVSKFTVAGTPTITNDGIASVTANGNMTQRVSIPFNFDLTAKKWSIISNFTTDTTVSAKYVIGSWQTNDSINCYLVGGYVFNFSLYVNIDGTRTQVATGNTSLSNLVQFRTNTKYVQIVSRNNDTYTYTIYNASNPSENGTITITSEYDLYNANVLCVYSNSSTSSLKSCNLKEVKVVVNDYPTFSGNKTGIDTVKPADYTVVGTGLTITNDGIASGFSASDYLTKTTAITLDKTTYFEFDVTFKTPSSWTKNGRFWAYGNKQNFGHTSGGVISGGFIGTSINQTGLSALATNTKYNAKYIYDENGFYVAYKNANETTWISSTPATVTSTETHTLQGAIGNAFTDTSAYFTGSIDLNSIKFYVNGNLVYQPCLLIPYNGSSTGSKVVDVAYRDRVQDVYEQYGSANYYTIDETNQNATLPMGEIYGFIRQADSDKIYKDLVPCYDSTKAISVPLLGNYTAPADGYVCSPNMVLTLDPDNGYENFSLTILRNTQSMTMISCTGPTAFPFCLPVLKNDVLTLAADATVTSNVYFIPREGV